jgi:glycosyltransferase involved in cell wall biosynthesis
MKLSIVIAAYNERVTIRHVVETALGVPLGDLDREVIVIDDGSTDGTREEVAGLANGCTVRVFRNDRNRGKGAAVRRGIAESSGQILLIQDADLEYDPRDYPALLAPILSGKADVVYGSRFLGAPGGHRVLYFWHAVGNRLLTLLSNAVSDLNLTDMETGFKVMTRDVALRLDLRSRRFGIEPEITCKVGRLGARVYEVPISYHGRTYAEGKKITFRDGLLAIVTILRFARWRGAAIRAAIREDSPDRPGPCDDQPRAC